MKCTQSSLKVKSAENVILLHNILIHTCGAFKYCPCVHLRNYWHFSYIVALKPGNKMNLYLDLWPTQKSQNWWIEMKTKTGVNKFWKWMKPLNKIWSYQLPTQVTLSVDPQVKCVFSHFHSVKKTAKYTFRSLFEVNFFCWYAKVHI